MVTILVIINIILLLLGIVSIMIWIRAVSSGQKDIGKALKTMNDMNLKMFKEIKRL